MAAGISLELLGQLLASKMNQSEGSPSPNEPRYLQTLDVEGVAEYIKKCMRGDKLKDYRETDTAAGEEGRGSGVQSGDAADMTIEDNKPAVPASTPGGACKEVEPQKDEPFIVVMTGAGLSTAAGIPDFRSPDSGLYARLKKDDSFDIPSPESIFHIDYFKDNPMPFVKLAQELFPGKFNPTKSHFFLRLLQEKGLLSRLYTQNIDGLERRAGIADEKLVEAHGSFHTASCVECREPQDVDLVKMEIWNGRAARCSVPECNGLVKPDIVFFGEALSPIFQQMSEQDLPACKLLIILGTSLKVQPFAGLVERVSGSCPRLLLNQEQVTGGDMFKAMLGMPTGLDFSDKSYRDVFQGGHCDDSCEKIATLLGWKEDLDTLYTKEMDRLKKEQQSDTHLKNLVQKDSAPEVVKGKL